MRLRERQSALLVVILAMVAVPVAGQRMPGMGSGIDLNLEGIVDPGPAAQVLGVLEVGAAGHTRKFGVVHARSSAGEGMSLFRAGALYPENLEILGRDSELRVFNESPAGTTLRMLGRLYPQKLIVGEVSVAESNSERTPEARSE